MNRKLFLIVIAMVFCGAALGLAEPLQKPARVAELEDSLTKDMSTYIRSRFPDRPFLLTVSVDPLRRYDGTKKTSQGEKLPYMDVDDDEITDEWDDPQVPLTELLNRTKKIVVTVSLPSDITDDEANELKDALFDRFHLLKARDDIQIQRRHWKGNDSTLIYSGIALSLLGLLVTGFFLIFRFAFGKVSSAIKESQAQASRGNLPSVGPPPSSFAKAPSRSENGDFKVSDPLKLRELVTHLIENISKRDGFPSLQDMIVLEEGGERSPAMIGALLAEFPDTVKKKVFAYSSTDWWLKAIVEPGTLDLEALGVLENLLRAGSVAHDASLQECLIAVWRLPVALRTQLFKQLGSETGLSLLNLLPKSISVDAGKRAFPGAWAGLLDPKFKGVKLSAETVKSVAHQAFQLLPKRDFTFIDGYRRDLELMKYLRTASLRDEKEIYDSLPKDSRIPQERPPFYALFESSSEDLKKFVNTIGPDTWALALLNIPFNERKKISDCFTEKQRLAFTENIRRLDADQPSARDIGSVRETIGQHFKMFFENVTGISASGTSESTTAGGDNEENETKVA